jgi:signal transduction histidine kinase
VSIRSVVADAKNYSPFSHPNFPALTKNLEIDYAGLSLSIPERVRFRYKLGGWDKEWHEAGGHRAAFFTGLRPGTYSFRVVACNNDGVWNEEGATLDFVIAPAWFQTNWFYALCVAAFLTALWALYQLRVRQLHRQFAIGIEARVNERTRIAREIHDTLLQSFQALLLQFQRASNLLPTRPEDAKKNLDNAINQTSLAIAEGRDAVQGLRLSTLPDNDFVVAVRSLATEVAASIEPRNGCASVEVLVEGTPRRLRPLVRDEVYRITVEALRNAFRHAQAKRIEVEIHYDSHQFRLRVRDDGKGIEPQVLGTDGRPGHFGLSGMQERARLIGGTVELWSEAAHGTEIELTITGFRAYETRTGRRFNLFPLKRA